MHVVIYWRLFLAVGGACNQETIHCAAWRDSHVALSLKSEIRRITIHDMISEPLLELYTDLDFDCPS